MYKSLKIFTLVILILFVCLNITYSVKSDDTGNQPSNPTAAEVTPAAEPVPAPAAESSPDAVPTPVPEQPAAEQTDEIQQAASDFYKEVDAIVMKRVNSFYKNGGKGTLGIYIKELKSSFEYSYNAEKTNPDNPKEGYFNTASTCKLLSAAVMYYLNNCGELELDKTYTDTVIKSKYNLKKILSRMISHSVNDYFNITLRHLGSKQINETLEKLGLKYSLVYSEIMPAQYSSVKNNIKRYGISRSPRTTPKDLGYVLDLLYAERTFGAKNDKLFVESLLNNIYSNRLPAGISYKSPVAHKTGTSSDEGVYNDAGIIFLEDNPYIMVVMSKGSSSSVQPLFRTIIGEVYQYMKKRTESQSYTKSV
ncbi:MAG: class A beta-lactamase-related serine hydrolase [Clostridiaceae bacterium]|nr:class A beta-lactamase-related serine hydrolase [Clostridiaceae bacterium]